MIKPKWELKLKCDIANVLDSKSALECFQSRRVYTTRYF